MSFSCLTLHPGRAYSALSDVTDKYIMGQRLRAKEFCELCIARERLSDRIVSCKRFHKKDGRKVRRAAKNEILILKMVNHPNILQLIDTFETREEYFIIQELATGGDLFDWILDQGSYTERHASNVIKQLLETVDYLHSLRIVHRNIKLENVMYHSERQPSKVVIGDFHLSRLDTGSLSVPCGTAEYLAPEVVARHRYGRPVDCWAVGVILYILLCGSAPFYDDLDDEEGDKEEEVEGGRGQNRTIFHKILAGKLTFPSPCWDPVSPAAKELVCRLMEVEQEQRITAHQALSHPWISGNAALERNLKLGVCTQIEKNFAKAKWKAAIRATTVMQRLQTSDQRALALTLPPIATETGLPAPPRQSPGHPGGEGDGAGGQGGGGGSCEAGRGSCAE